MSSRFKRLNYLLAVAILLLISGCSSISYYGQSIVGHSRLMLARQSIDKALLTAESGLKANLQLALALRQYSVTTLALPDNGSYSTYVALQREFPVWTVVAADEFSIEAKTWCYPVIGCANYRGYFSQQAAQAYADSLVAKGLETTVSGATAYSTLGWFDDPVVPSMMRYGEADFAESLFHELAHQQLYIKGNSAFNEAFATVVGEQGTIRWLSHHHSDLLADYRQRLAARKDFSLLLATTKAQLEDLYAANKNQTDMRESKLQIFDNLKTDYAMLKMQKWQDFAWFDRWFEQPVNNARLAAFATYRDWVPSFTLLLEQCESDFARFYASLISGKELGHHGIVPEQCIATRPQHNPSTR